MKERPILFSARMVRALLDGSKTQTRRVVKPCPDWAMGKRCMLQPHELAGEVNQGEYSNCPYGQPGDRLWVKETTVNVEDFGYLGPVWVESEYGRNVLEYGLAPSDDDFTEVEPEDLRLRPSIFMTRAMSRITLEITGVRVERLQNISKADAIAEGLTSNSGLYASPGQMWQIDPRKAYSNLWESINGPGSWDANPWVWVIEFKVLKGGGA